MLSAFSYKTSKFAWRELLKRCKGSEKEAHKDIMRGLNIPQIHKNIVKTNRKGDIVEIYLTSKYVESLEDVIVYDDDL